MKTARAIGLLIYSIVIIGNIDYVAALHLTAKRGTYIRVITILGLIAGLEARLLGLYFSAPLLIELSVAARQDL